MKRLMTPHSFSGDGYSSLATRAALAAYRCYVARALLVCMCWLASVSLVQAQFRETFESPDPAWKLANADCGVRIVSHKRSFEQAHGGATCEHMRFIAGRGTHLYYTFGIDRSPIIDESNVSLWLKADRARLQLLARVVLPRSLDEKTGQPISALLQGSEYGEIGTWQRLEVKDVPKLLARQLVVLRRQFGPQVDATEAYIDLLVVNAYGGAGETNVWIDDLEVIGVLDPQWARRTVPEGTANAETATTARSSFPGSSANSAMVSSGAPATSTVAPAVLEGSVLLVENRPLLVRGIEHRGEPLEVLKTLGFNAVLLRTPPTLEINQEAKRLGLWLVSAPPDLDADRGAAARLDRVIAWHVGENLGKGELASASSMAASLRAADGVLRRPLVAGVRGDAWSYSREFDVLQWNTPFMFGPASLSAVATTVQAKALQARVGSPFWTAVHFGPSPAFEEQLGLLDKAAPRTLTADLAQARLATLAALSSGARGLMFYSTSRLDADDEIAQQRSAVMRLLNLELNLIEPWFAGGSAPQDVSTGDPTLKATLLQTERSRLVILTRDQPLAQFVTPPSAADTMLLALPGVPAADRFYHLTTDGLRELRSPVGSNGSKIVVPEAGQAALLAITQDALVIQHLTTRSEAQRREGVEARLRLASNNLVHSAFVAEQVRSNVKVPPEGLTMFREAQRYLQEAEQSLATRDLTGCYRHTRRGEILTAQARRTWWDAARTGFASPLTSPCCVSYDLLPAHVRLGFRLQQSQWTRNALPAGDCEQLDRLIESGWRQTRHESPDLVTRVELTTDTPHGGVSSVLLSATTTSARLPLLDETPAVAITTAPIEAREGQIARLHGFVRVPTPLAGPDAGLRIYDNHGGVTLADSVAHAPAWREFSLYRAIPKNGPLTLTFALHGLGTAAIDDVSIELANPEVSPERELGAGVVNDVALPRSVIRSPR